MKKIVSAAIGMAMTLGATGSAFAGDMINGAGATFPFPLYSAWAFAYEKETGIKLNYQSIGSGGGVRVDVNKRVVKFFDWTFSGASDAKAKELVYAPLPDALKKKVREYWKANGLY